MKLVAIDLDGTLLNHEKKISEINKKAVQKAYHSGIKVVLATGRSLISAREIFNELEIEGYLIVLNGALVKEGNSNQTIFSSQLRKEALVKSLEVGYQEEVTVIFNSEERNYHVPFTGIDHSKKEFYLKRGNVIEMNFTKMMDILKYNSEKIMKVTFTSNNTNRLRSIQDIMNKANYYPVFSDSHFIEMMDYGVNKGNSLLRICQHLNIEAKDIVAFGDQENDIQMIQIAGIGVAMGNATSKLMRVADEIAGINNESGVGERLLELLSTES